MSRRRTLRSALEGWLLVVPAIVFVVVVMVGPAIASLYYSFTDWSGLGKSNWIGTANYEQLLGDRLFWNGLGNNIRYTLFSLAVLIPIALLLSALLAQIKRGRLLFRVLFFIPFMMASIVAANIWHQVYDPQVGLGATLVSAGFTWADVNVIGDPGTALFAAALADNWHELGFLIVLYLAATQTIDTELYEAARMDGANRLDEFVHITIPGILPTLAFSILIIIIGSFLAFDYVWLMTAGGPAHASEVLNVMAYRAFTLFESGYASAIGVSTTVLVAFAGGVFLVLRRLGMEI